jgi:predicted nucleic acid-binding protein
MTFSDIPGGVSLFVDANTLVYHFGPHPTFRTACQQLLERIARQEITGTTSTHAVSDMAHRLMTLEAMARYGWPAAGIVRRLRQHPAELQQLSRFRQAIDELPQFGIQVVPVTQALVSAAATISQQHGLLGGDALIVAVMREHGLVNLASHDADFDRAAGLTRYGPG